MRPVDFGFSHEERSRRVPGEVEVFIDGRSVILAKGLILRDEDAAESSVQGLHFQTFFGGERFRCFCAELSLIMCVSAGHTEEWACPKDQKAWFTNVSGAILRSVPAHDEL